MASRIQGAEHSRNYWSLTLLAGESMDRVFEPNFFKPAVRRIRIGPGDLIEVRAPA
jgi:hypothetical protein